MSQTTQDIVAKLWNLCNVLKDDGVTYHQYVNDLTYLLFLKMAQETAKLPKNTAEKQIAEGYRWADLVGKGGTKLMEHYRLLLVHLGSHGSARVKARSLPVSRLSAQFSRVVCTSFTVISTGLPR